MFLGVSGSVRVVDMDERQRANFATWLLGLQRSKYDNNAKAAYTAAGVNSGTWTRATTGMTLAPRTVSKIVNAFRPDAGGDWTRLDFDRDGDATVGGDGKGGTYVHRAPRTADEEVEDAATDNAVLNAIQQMQRDLQALRDELGEVRNDVAGLSERVADSGK